MKLVVSHFNAIGFGGEEDLLTVILLSLEKGNNTFRDKYGYFNLEINDGIEILSITHSNNHVTTKPYFKSGTSIPVTLSDNISTGAAFNCEKRLIAYSIPDEIPINFDYSYEHEIPKEFDTEEEFQLYLTAFARTLKIFKKPDDFIKKIPVHPDRRKSFGSNEVSFSPNFYMQGSDGVSASFGGRVLDTKIITNTLTGKKVRWLKVDNILGNLEIVFPEIEINEELLKGYFVVGEFWLIGYIDAFHIREPKQTESEEQHKKKDKTYDFDVGYIY